MRGWMDVSIVETYLALYQLVSSRTASDWAVKSLVRAM